MSDKTVQLPEGEEKKSASIPEMPHVPSSPSSGQSSSSSSSGTASGEKSNSSPQK